MIENIERARDGVDSLIDRTRDAVVDATDRAESGVASAAERVVRGTHTAGEVLTPARQIGGGTSARSQLRCLARAERKLFRSRVSAQSASVASGRPASLPSF